MRKIIVAALFMLIMALYGVGNPVSTKEVKAYEYKLSKSQQKNAEIIANETGAKIYKLNTSLNGEINNTSYINEMKENIRILKDVEGNED